jgi:uncharacterized protein
MIEIKAIYDVNHQLLADHIEVPSTELAKMRGLLPYTEVPPRFAMVFEGAKQIHMFFMRTAIDVLYLDQDKKVLHAGTIKPWRFGPYKWKTKWIVEARQGTFAHLQPGEVIHFI